MLDDLIKMMIEEIETENDSDVRTELIKNLETLYKLRIEDEKNRIIEYNNEVKTTLDAERLDFDKQSKEDEKAFDEEKLVVSKRENQIKFAIGVATIVVPLIFYGTLFSKGLKFEETGSISSTMVKNLLSKLRLTL